MCSRDPCRELSAASALDVQLPTLKSRQGARWGAGLLRRCSGHEGGVLWRRSTGPCRVPIVPFDLEAWNSAKIVPVPWWQ
jgi:hypothetical protein